MKSLENYSDLCTDLLMIELDLERVDADMDYWFGQGGIMLGSEGARSFGSKEAILRIEHLHHKKHALLKRHEHYKEMRKDYEDALLKLNDLESKINVMRVVKKMTLKEIANELKYSESHIRKLSTRVNKMIHTPLTQDVVLYK
jgi:RNA polymerase sigma factor (sigma-70 family)